MNDAPPTARPGAVLRSTDLFDYFHLRVREAEDGRSRGLSDDVLLYLAQLLAERARADRGAPPDETFAELHLRAAGARPAEQARAYRELGDRSLHGLGWFREHWEGRTVSVRYVEDMGRAAYHRVDAVMATFFARAFGAVFEELARRFDDCAGLLRELRGQTPDDLDTLYAAWLETGDEAAARALRRRGLVLPARPERA